MDNLIKYHHLGDLLIKVLNSKLILIWEEIGEGLPACVREIRE